MQWDRLTDAVHSGEVLRAQQTSQAEQLAARSLEEFAVPADELIAGYGPDVPVPPTPQEMAEYQAAKDRGDEVTQPPAMRYDRPSQERRLKRAERDLTALGKVNPLALDGPTRDPDEDAGDGDGQPFGHQRGGHEALGERQARDEHRRRGRTGDEHDDRQRPQAPDDQRGDLEDEHPGGRQHESARQGRPEHPAAEHDAGEGRPEGEAAEDDAREPLLALLGGVGDRDDLVGAEDDAGHDERRRHDEQARAPHREASRAVGVRHDRRLGGAGRQERQHPGGEQQLGDEQAGLGEPQRRHEHREHRAHDERRLVGHLLERHRGVQAVRLVAVDVRPASP